MKLKDFQNTHPETTGRDHFVVILIQRGIGLIYDAAIGTFHQNCASFDAFRNYVKRSMDASITEMNAFLFNPKEEKTTLSHAFAFLAHQMLKSSNKTKEQIWIKRSCKGYTVLFIQVRDFLKKSCCPQS